MQESSFGAVYFSTWFEFEELIRMYTSLLYDKVVLQNTEEVKLGVNVLFASDMKHVHHIQCDVNISQSIFFTYMGNRIMHDSCSINILVSIGEATNSTLRWSMPIYTKLKDSTNIQDQQRIVDRNSTQGSRLGMVLTKAIINLA